jgi:hypothetical protein
VKAAAGSIYLFVAIEPFAADQVAGTKRQILAIRV